MDKDYFVLYTPEEMNKAYQLMQKKYSITEVMNILQGNDDILKQVCLIDVNEINSVEQAESIVSVLTGQHGPVREICSAKINELLKNENFSKYFIGQNILETFLNALNDIIPTVARNILDVMKFLPQKEMFYDLLLDRILDLKNYEENQELLSNHEINKKTFKLYWYLEALSEYAVNLSENNKLKEIIENTYKHEDYTIREKVAKILVNVQGFDNYKEVLKHDENPYVFANFN